jgi:hypothetical protein
MKSEDTCSVYCCLALYTAAYNRVGSLVLYPLVLNTISGMSKNLLQRFPALTFILSRSFMKMLQQPEFAMRKSQKPIKESKYIRANKLPKTENDVQTISQQKTLSIKIGH